MRVHELLSFDLPLLSLEDSGDKVLSLMSEYRVFHLPLVHRDNYLALISEDDILDWDTPEQPLSLAEFLHFRPSISLHAHPLEAIKIVKDYNLSILPVLDEHNHFAGMLSQEKLFQYLANNNAVNEEGGILLLSMESRNYSMSEIARICESNDVSILLMSMRSLDDNGMIEITLKVNKKDLQALKATFERYSYTITQSYAVDTHLDDLKSNFDMLMHMINM